MKILFEEKWRDGYLDYCRREGEVTVSVLANITLAEVGEQFFVREKSFSLLWNYFREIGFFNVARKVVSRTNEKIRNDKYLSIGIGKIVDGSNGYVVYLAPSHPKCVDRLSIPEAFSSPVDISDFTIDLRKITYAENYNDAALSDVRNIAGWSGFSGEKYNEAPRLMDAIATYLKKYNWLDATTVETTHERDTATAIGQLKTSTRPSAILFGYGNYAKTVILPSIAGLIDVAGVNEVDPTQLPMKRDPKKRWSTSPELESSEKTDLLLIAGYHHTHASLAVEALNRNMHAVVEKPLVTDRKQLMFLEEAIQSSKGHYFACFHKRYLPFNKYVFEDFCIKRGDRPVSYHCVVYEVPLPDNHWYRWPNSGSRLLSNGCHWLDHFLWLNNYARVTEYDLFISKNGVINCSVELENKASFSMLLTDEGSARVGMQDYIELRYLDKTIYIKNGAKYFAEDGCKILRSKTCNKMKSYQRMYRTIAEKIHAGKGGDTIESVMRSSELVLDLEELYQKKSAGIT